MPLNSQRPMAVAVFKNVPTGVIGQSEGQVCSMNQLRAMSCVWAQLWVSDSLANRQLIGDLIALSKYTREGEELFKLKDSVGTRTHGDETGLELPHAGIWKSVSNYQRREILEQPPRKSSRDKQPN